MTTETTNISDAVSPRRRVHYDGKTDIRRWRLVIACLALIVPPVFIVALCSPLPPWVMCWGLSFAIYAGCKLLTWFDVRRQARGASFGRNLGYLLAWPGMDAKAFLDVSRQPDAPRIREWLFAAAKTALGLTMIIGIAGRVPEEYPLLAGWVVMFGLIFTLHFGLFHLLALAWQRNGVDAVPLMRNPAMSTSLADFWSARWNLAFRDLSHTYLFRPLRRSLGLAGTTAVTFLISGLVHDLVISVPAGAGYGGPTVFFLIQAAGLLFERSVVGRRIGLGRGATGWFFTLIITIGPVYWLFHPAFVMRVIIPMACALGAM